MGVAEDCLDVGDVRACREGHDLVESLLVSIDDQMASINGVATMLSSNMYV